MLEKCTNFSIKMCNLPTFSHRLFDTCSQLLGASPRENFGCETRKEVNVPERVAGLLYEEGLVGGVGTGVGETGVGNGDVFCTMDVEGVNIKSYKINRATTKKKC